MFICEITVFVLQSVTTFLCNESKAWIERMNLKLQTVRFPICNTFIGFVSKGFNLDHVFWSIAGQSWLFGAETPAFSQLIQAFSFVISAAFVTFTQSTTQEGNNVCILFRFSLFFKQAPVSSYRRWDAFCVRNLSLSTVRVNFYSTFIKNKLLVPHTIQF